MGYEIHVPLDRGGDIELRVPAIKKWEFIQSVRNLEKSGIPEPGIPHPLEYPRFGKILKQQLARVNSRLGFMSHAKTCQLRNAAMETLKAKTAWGNVDDYENLANLALISRHPLLIKTGLWSAYHFISAELQMVKCPF